jgi:hypothetical protein
MFMQAIAAAPAPDCHDLGFAQILAHEPHGVEHSCGNDDGGSVLVVMKHRDFHAIAQGFFDLEAFGSLDVFEVYAAKARLERCHNLDEALRVLFVHLDIDGVDTSELLEKNGFASITGLDARAPILPSPNTAVPLEITATRLPFEV